MAKLLRKLNNFETVFFSPPLEELSRRLLFPRSSVASALEKVLLSGALSSLRNKIPKLSHAHFPIQIRFCALWIKSLTLFLVLEREMTPNRYTNKPFLYRYRLLEPSGAPNACEVVLKLKVWLQGKQTVCFGPRRKREAFQKRSSENVIFLTFLTNRTGRVF